MDIVETQKTPTIRECQWCATPIVISSWNRSKKYCGLKCRRRAMLARKNYGVSPRRILRMREEQANQCDICHIELTDSFHIDHDHYSPGRKVRGLLCSSCNLALGGFEAIMRIPGAIDYVRKHDILCFRI